jgi:hypothetical protein
MVLLFLLLLLLLLLLMAPQLILLDLDRFTSSLSYTQLVRLLSQAISLSHVLYLHTGQHKKMKARRHPCLEWDSNPRTQYSCAEDSSCLNRAATLIGVIVLFAPQITTGLTGSSQAAASSSLSLTSYLLAGNSYTTAPSSSNWPPTTEFKTRLNSQQQH